MRDIDANTFYFVHTPSRIPDLIRSGGKLFKDGNNKLQNKEAFEFLQSIIESQEIKVTIRLNAEELEKFRQENQELQAHQEIPPK
jgi:hypothetical protein